MSALAAPARAYQPSLNAMRAAPAPRRRAAETFMSPLASLAAIPALPAVQRACASCESDDREELPVQPRLEVGPVGDHHEQEADAIAGEVMAMPAAEAEAGAADPSVQRMCEGCAGEEGEEEETAVQPRLEVGPVGDRYEQEADAIAGQVMAMREAEVSGADPAVQRACSSCSASDDEPRARRTPLEISADEDEPRARRTPAPIDADEEVEAPVRARRSAGADGGETIGASHGELTGGGSGLPAATRGFFESRMGRDLSGVRIHQGGAAEALNQSISSRAFTYHNHIWLGAGESASPGFTMAHELAHVMQQTAPGPVGPQRREEASAADASVQRTYYYEQEGKALPATHDEIVNLLTGMDSSVFAEVPVPNANARGRQITKKRFGRADLVKFTGSGANVPVGMSTAPCPKGQQDYWYCTSSEMRTANRKPTTLDEGTIGKGLAKKTMKIIHSGSDWNGQETQSVPRYGFVTGAAPINGFVRDAGGIEKAAKPTVPNPTATVPAGVNTHIEIGDVKAGAFPSARSKAIRQIANYMLGFQESAELYEDVRASVENKRADMKAAGKNDFSSLPPALTPWKVTADLIGSISGVKPVHKVFAATKRIILKRWTSDNEGGIARSDPVPGAVATDGNLFLWKDSGVGAGAWSYLWSPDDSEASKLHAALGPDPDYDTLKKNSLCLREALLIPASPPKAGSPAATRSSASPAPGCLKPLRIGQAPANVIRRAPPKKPAKPKPPEDPFKAHFDAWQVKQTGLTTGFAKYEKSPKGEERHGAIAELEARETIAKSIPGKEKVLSEKGATALKEQGSEFFWLETLGGRSGRLIGQLRLRFGGLFERLVSAYATMKEKVTAFLEKLSPKKPGKGLGRAVLTLVSKLLGAIGRWVLPRVTQALQDCLEEGVSNKVEEMFSDGPLAAVREKVDAVIAFANELTEGVVTSVTGIGDRLVGDLKGTFDKIKEAGQFISDIVEVGKGVFDAVRLAICAAGGIESFGLSCAVSLIDKVLSFFDASPLEALGESLLSTCMGQTLLTDALMGFEAVKNLPKTIAGTIVDLIKPKLPEAAQGLLCDTAKMKFEMPAVSDVTCGSGGSPGATPGPGADGSYTKGGWTPPGGYTERDRQKVEDRAKQEGTETSPPPPPEPKKGEGTQPPPPEPKKEEPPPPEPKKEEGTGETPGEKPPTQAPAETPDGGQQPAKGGGKGGTGDGVDNRTRAERGWFAGETEKIGGTIYVHPTPEQGGFGDKDYKGMASANKMTIRTGDPEPFGPSKDKISIKIGTVTQDTANPNIHHMIFETDGPTLITRERDGKQVGFAAGKRKGRVGGVR